MNSLRYILFACLAAGTLPTQVIARPATFQPIIFASTGHKSCRKDGDKRKNSPYKITLEPHVSKLIEELKKTFDNIDPKVIYACFEYGKEPFGGRQTFRYTLPNNEIGEVKMGKKALFDRIDEEYMEPAIDAALVRLNDEINAARNHAVYFIGHSWGGWLSLKLAQTLAPDVNIDGMVTIDPISPLDCWPNLYIRPGPNYIKNCRQFPKDITPEDQEWIKDRVKGEWMHYYQRQFFFAKSGPLSALKEGVRSFKVKVKRWSINHHSRLQSEPRIWRHMTTTLKRRL